MSIDKSKTACRDLLPDLDALRLAVRKYEESTAKSPSTPLIIKQKHDLDELRKRLDVSVSNFNQKCTSHDFCRTLSNEMSQLYTQYQSCLSLAAYPVAQDACKLKFNELLEEGNKNTFPFYNRYCRDHEV